MNLHLGLIVSSKAHCERISRLPTNSKHTSNLSKAATTSAATSLSSQPFALLKHIPPSLPYGALQGVSKAPQPLHCGERHHLQHLLCMHSCTPNNMRPCNVNNSNSTKQDYYNNSMRRECFNSSNSNSSISCSNSSNNKPPLTHSRS